MCSAKWAIPRFGADSYREPAAKPTTQATDGTCGINAVRTRMPLERVACSKVGTGGMV
jgi:hypothetical protein